ncbi:hypothetical protein [Streptomyces sp. NPDC048606]|uniref:hypothetical protein n=1 Tax=Streptomyces sp. NPDC048606 TaxID=3154726 RepID=UPI00343CA599
MRRLPLLAAPLVALPVLLLTGCSDAVTGADIGAGPFPSATPSPTQSPSPSPSPSPSATQSQLVLPPTPLPSWPVGARTPATDCTPTSGLDAQGLTSYFKNLKSSDTKDSPALFMVDDGVFFRLKDTRPPCESVPVKLSHFRVDMAHSKDSSGYTFTYKALRTLTLAVGPRDGKVDDSTPPATEHCAGVLSVIYEGQDLDQDDLPENLRLPAKDSTLDWTLVEVKREGALDAVFKPPADARSC